VSWSGVEDLQSTRHTAARLAPWWLHLSTAAAAVAGLCAIYVVSIAPLRCNRQLRQLEEATTLTLRSPAQIAAPAARETLEKTGSLLGHCRNRLPLLMVRAANLRALGRREEAAAAYREALVIEKRPEIYFQLGTTLFEDGRVQDSVEEYARACRFQPSLLSEVPQPVRDEVESRLR
jgi:tetratricopeptide (TPR) repeat protein